MKNPLKKSLKRELKCEWGRYLAIFLFIFLMIGFISGFLATDNSMQIAYDESFKKYNIEDGHFRLSDKITAETRQKIEKKFDIKLFDLSYKELRVGEKKYRIYINREKINKASIFDGRLAEKNDEINIDRLFAENNKLKLGDILELNNTKFKIVGLVAYSDYSALFPKNTDTVFDTQGFTVATVSKGGFEKLKNVRETCVIAWKNNKNLSQASKKTVYEDMTRFISFETAQNNINLDEFIPEIENQAIRFTGNDMGRDKSMMLVFLYIVMVIMAFIFAIATMNTVERESKAIGTLLAMGYTRSELTRHLMKLPVYVTLAAAIAGNIAGYSYFRNVFADLYYASYSLPPYKMVWSSYAFYATTVSTIVIMLVINFTMIYYSLRRSPLKFLRCDLGRPSKSNAVKLPPLGFLSRFCMRIILQNKWNFLVLFIGVAFASSLLLYGLSLKPLFVHYKDTIEANSPAKYQYILKAPIETKVEDAERLSFMTLGYKHDGFDKDEDIFVYGVSENSKHYKGLPALPDDENSVIVTDSYLKKFNLDVGDKIELKTKYADKRYTFKIAGSYDFKQGISMFMSETSFQKTFDKDKSWFNAYLSDTKLNDIDSKYIYSISTPHDYSVVADQMLKSMDGVFGMIVTFSIIMSIVLAYLLTKVIIDRNVIPISIIKILGYRNTEITKLYIIASAAVYLLSLIASIPFAIKVLDISYAAAMHSVPGWIDIYIEKSVYFKVIVLSLSSFVISSILQFRHIKKIPMEDALKNIE